MNKKPSFTRMLIVLTTVLSLSIAGIGPTEAKPNLAAGTVFKGKGHSTLYYLTENNERLVFPNAKTYFSWYENFDNVVEVDDEELAEFRLTGNARYKPGVLLVKLVSVPKVYAVGANGRSRAKNWHANSTVKTGTSL